MTAIGGGITSCTCPCGLGFYKSIYDSTTLCDTCRRNYAFKMQNVAAVQPCNANTTNDWSNAFTPKDNDPVNHPQHYKQGEVDPLALIEAAGWGPQFCKGNVIKYTYRAGKKEGATELLDLKKAKFYLDKAISYIE